MPSVGDPCLPVSCNVFGGSLIPNGRSKTRKDLLWSLMAILTKWVVCTRVGRGSITIDHSVHQPDVCVEIIAYELVVVRE